MAGFELKIEGDKELKKNLAKFAKVVESDVEKVVNATGFAVQRDIKLRIQNGPATGKTYTRRGVSHRASKAGEAPMSDTGRLAASVLFRRIGKFGAAVLSRLDYALWLEKSTMHIAKRPAWLPAAEKARPLYVERMTKVLKRAIQKVGK